MMRPVARIRPALCGLLLCAASGCYSMYSSPYGTPYGGYGYPSAPAGGYAPYGTPMQTMPPGTTPYLPPAGGSVPMNTYGTSLQAIPGGINGQNYNPPANSGNIPTPDPYPYDSTSLPPVPRALNPAGGVQPAGAEVLNMDVNVQIPANQIPPVTTYSPPAQPLPPVDNLNWETPLNVQPGAANAPAAGAIPQPFPGQFQPN